MGRNQRINTPADGSAELRAQMREARQLIIEFRAVIAEGRKLEADLKRELPTHISALSRDAVEKVVGSHINPELERLRAHIDNSIETKRKQIVAHFDQLMDVLMHRKQAEPSMDEIIRVTEWMRYQQERRM